MKKVLFIGNSFTYFHDMPAMVQQLCCWRQNTLHAVKLTYGGYYLDQYLQPGTEAGERFESLLTGETWDYVVLQEQSSAPAVNRERFLKAARTLCSRIRAIGAQPVFYSTWGYKDQFQHHPEVTLDYDSFCRELDEGYRIAAEENQAALIKVGQAFRRAADNGLYETVVDPKDDFHPALGGSYLAALCFARYFMGPDFRPEWKPAGPDAAIVLTLQKLAD